MGNPSPLVTSCLPQGIYELMSFEQNGMALAQMRDDSLEKTLALLPLHSPNRRAPFQTPPSRGQPHTAAAAAGAPAAPSLGGLSLQTFSPLPFSPDTSQIVFQNT